MSVRGYFVAAFPPLCAFTLAITVLTVFTHPRAQAAEPGLIFSLSGETGHTAEYAAGDSVPAYLRNIDIVPDGASGRGFRAADFEQAFAFHAPGNMFAQRGTLAFFFRARYPYGKAPFKIFQASYCDHSSFDMVFLRIDYTGRGFDAFVTDSNLGRVRVSFHPPALPSPDAWTHLALSWDETYGIRFYLNGKLAARRDTTGVFDAGLAFFGTHGYLVNPLSVSSGGSDIRSGDFDEFRVYDRMLAPDEIARLAKGMQAGTGPSFPRSISHARDRAEWFLRHGWSGPGGFPPTLDHASTMVRKIEIHDAYDLKQWMWKGCDGIRETTWPGVYNRSRLPGRKDYFILPDWNCYSVSGDSVSFTLPGEKWNHVEITGAAYGCATYRGPGTLSGDEPVFTRPRDRERTVHRLSHERSGGVITFRNDTRESPIGEFMVYHVMPGTAPKGSTERVFTVTGAEPPDTDAFRPLVNYIRSRHLPDERAVTSAIPEGTPLPPAYPRARSLPLVHIIVPYEYRDDSGTTARLPDPNTGLDGVEITLPPLGTGQTGAKPIALNIQVRDPLWPNRALIDFSCSVKPRTARTLWLDSRDRILPAGESIYIRIAASDGSFNAATLRGMRVRLVFKPSIEATPEHIADRFTQVRDNYGFIIESRPTDRKLGLYDRFYREVTDLLRVAPDHIPGLYYRAHGVPGAKWPPFTQSVPPAGVPLWAYRQVEYLRLAGEVILWWIDHRQIPSGEFGGGLSDDSDMTHSWPIPALMGVEPDRITDSLSRELDAIYANGMLTDGLNTALLDALHTTEEGTNVQAQLMHLAYGDPKLVERMMESARGFERVTAVNAAGHRHFRSSYFSATMIVDEDPWLWTVEQTFRLLHPGLSLVEFNGHPRAKALLLEMADGLLAHREKGPDGGYSTPGTIHFRTDEDKPSSFGAADHLFWGAWRWTGDRKYLDPLMDLGTGMLPRLNANALDMLGLRDTLGKETAASATPSGESDFARYAAWLMTGDTSYLAGYYEDQIRVRSQQMYLNTEGHVWTDRLSLNLEELQRSRLGGVARRAKSYIYPGHAVSWRFREPSRYSDAAILIPFATPDSLRIVAWNLSDRPVTAIMTAWDVNPGMWMMRGGIDRDENGIPDKTPAESAIRLERTEPVELMFAPHVQTVFEFALRKRGTPYWNRPDLGIGPYDIHREGNILRVRVHSLGSVDAPPVTVALVDGADTIISKTSTPRLEAPLDYRPRTAEVELTIPVGAKMEGYSVAIDPGRSLEEITRMNNRVALDSNTK